MSSAPKRSALSADRPFPGLRSYRAEDHEFFFGRQDQYYSLYRFLDHSRFIAVVGSSGSGKSSLVRAGLLPLLLEENKQSNGRTWKIVEFHPGDTPIGNLATSMASLLSPGDDPNIVAARRERLRFALRRSSFGMADALREADGLDGAAIVLVVDQFEELFRYAARGQGADSAEATERHEEAIQFVQVLLGASRDRALNVYVLLTMRSDFIGDCAGFRGLPEAVSASQYLVPSLTRDQREEVIRGPIKKAGASIEPALVERLLNDGGDDMDQLPVLQHCLSRLWEQAGAAPNGGRNLTMEQYDQIGGMSGALSQHADKVLEDLSDLELAVEQTFRSLAEIDNEGRIIRRARLFKELFAETGIPAPDLRRVVDRFREEDCSFLTPPKAEASEVADDTRIDVGHEALLRRWEHVSGDPRSGSPYTGWLRAEVSDGRAYRGLLAMAESRGGRIATDAVEERWKWWNRRPRTADWAKRYGGGIEDVERLFQDSLAALEAERGQQRRREDAEREQERRRAEEAADRQRIELEAAAARDREAAALRFARLARTAAISVSLVLLVAVFLGIAAAWQWRVAKQETDIAVQQRRLADQQRETAKNNLKISISLATTLQSQVQDLLDQGKISVDAAKQLLAAANTSFANFKAADQEPAIMSSWIALLLASADTYVALQDDKTALQMSQQAQEFAKKLVAMDVGNADYQSLLYMADYNCGDVDPDSSTSMRDYSAALSIAQSLEQSDATQYLWKQRAAFVMNKIGDTYDFQDRHDLAVQTYLAALAINQQIADAHPEIPELQRDLATAFMRVGDAEKHSDPQDAAARYNRALTLRKSLVGHDPGNAALQSNLSVSYNHLAALLVRQSNFADAAALYASALTIRKNLAKGDPSNLVWQSNLAYQYVDLGDMMMAKPDYAAATDNYRLALKIREALAAGDATNFTWMRYLADSHSRLAGALLAQNSAVDALAEHDAALPLRVAIGAQFPNSVTRQRELIGEYVAIGDILGQGDPQGALAHYQDALDVVQTYMSGHPASTAFDTERDAITQKIQSVKAKNP